MIANTSTPVDDLLVREDLGLLLREHDRDSSQHKYIITYAEKHLPRIVSAIQKPSNTSTQVSNAADLLVQLILEDDRLDTIRKVVPPTLGTLAKKGIVSTCSAQALQIVLINAFDKNFKTTTAAISITLSDEIIHGAIRNLSCSATVSGTLVALFGAALPTSTMLSPSTVPQSFTSTWIKKNFPLHLVQYITIAMSSPECKPYFSFMSEVFKRSFSQGGGPLVDDILAPSSINELTHAVVQAALASDGGPNNFPLAGDGVALLATIVNVVKRSLIPSQTSGTYRIPILDHSAPLQSILGGAVVGDSLIRLLDNDATVAGTLRTKQLGSLRLAICELYAEVALLHLRQTDEVLLAINFPDSLFSLVRRFPQNDNLVRILEKFLTSLVSQRAVAAVDGRANQFIDEDLLWIHFFASSPPAADGSSGRSRLADLLLDWASSPELSNTTLQAYSISLCVKLSDSITALSSGANGRPVLLIPSIQKNPFQTIVERGAVADKLYVWNTPITGKGFSERGSGCPAAAVVHRPLRNPTNISLETSDEISNDALDDIPPPRLPPVAAVTIVAATPGESSSSIATSSSDRGSRYASRFDFDGPQVEAASSRQAPDGGFTMTNFHEIAEEEAEHETTTAAALHQATDLASPDYNHRSQAANHLFFADDDDDVNLDDQDGELIVQRRASASLEADDDAQWVTQTIRDVANALDSSPLHQQHVADGVAPGNTNHSPNFEGEFTEIALTDRSSEQ